MEFENIEKIIEEYQKLKEGVELLQAIYVFGIDDMRKIHDEKYLNEEAMKLRWRLEDYFA